MRKRIGMAAGVLTIIAAAGCAAPTPREVDEQNRQTLRREVDDEVTVGREIAAKLLGHYKHYPGAEAVEYVNLVGQTIARQAGRPELKWRFAILNSEDQNAFACPGGYVFVTKGLFKRLRSESEFAGVIAHEVAHINEKHMYLAIMPKKDVGTSETLARLFSRGYGDLGASLSRIVDQGVQMLMKTGYGKEKEFAADQAGVTYASTVGYDSQALVQVIERLERSPNAVVVSKTHPPTADRLAMLKTYLKQSGLDRAAVTTDAHVMATRFERAQKTLETGKK